MAKSRRRTTPPKGVVAAGLAAQAPLSERAERKLRVKHVAIGRLVAHARNARTHSKRQVEQLVASIREFGWMNPVLIDDAGIIIAGHGRVLAAQELTMARVPCIEVAGLTAAQKSAYRIADNKLAERGGWDAKLLALEVGELELADFDLKVIGFNPKELQAYRTPTPAGALEDPDPESDPLPEAPALPVAMDGDLWLCGRHRLLCGDATDAAAVGRLLDGGDTPNLMVTDPPWGVEYDPSWRNEALPDGTRQRGQGAVKNDDRADWRAVWVHFPGEVIYVWHCGLHTSAVAAGIRASSFELRAQIVWRKPGLVVGRGHYHSQHEPCWYAVRKGGKAHWRGDRKQSTVWDIPNRRAEAERTDHGTQKPVACMLRPILNHTEEGMSVYDPFMGSGTTMIAAEQSGRIAYGLDIDPAYVDVAIERWERLTGEEARLADDGRTFGEVKAARAKEAA